MASASRTRNVGLCFALLSTLIFGLQSQNAYDLDENGWVFAALIYPAFAVALILVPGLVVTNFVLGAPLPYPCYCIALDQKHSWVVWVVGTWLANWLIVILVSAAWARFSRAGARVPTPPRCTP